MNIQKLMVSFFGKPFGNAIKNTIYNNTKDYKFDKGYTKLYGEKIKNVIVKHKNINLELHYGHVWEHSIHKDVDAP